METSAPFFRVERTHLAQQGEQRLQGLLNKIMNIRSKNFTMNTVTVPPPPPPPSPFPLPPKNATVWPANLLRVSNFENSTGGPALIEILSHFLSTSKQKSECHFVLHQDLSFSYPIHRVLRPNLSTLR